jgi:hypothetical protein
MRRASKETWRAFCTSNNELAWAARLHMALSKDPNARLGFLVSVPNLKGKPSTSYCGSISRTPGRRVWRPQPIIVALRDGIGGKQQESSLIEE